MSQTILIICWIVGMTIILHGQICRIETKLNDLEAKLKGRDKL